MPTLEIRHLSKRYNGLPAVDNANFVMESGEILGYVGPNGAGKSTTVKMIAGLIEPSEGQILYRGRSILDDLAGFQSCLGYVPEEPNLYPYLSGREYLQLAGRLRGMARAGLNSKIERFLTLFSLWDDRDCPVSSYSKGMRQKILLSAALLHNPEILVLDEPLSGLDVTTMLALRDLLQELADQGCAIFYSSHVLEVVEKVCSRVVVIREGRIVADDAVASLREQTHQASLEGVFSRLAADRDPAQLAGRILEAMRC